ncbi:MAG: hypothetical protein NUV51_09420 [Sulfuricaulis sp.]|nr:hypothetical protein [Sulfuricaulis sp.]
MNHKKIGVSTHPPKNLAHQGPRPKGRRTVKENLTGAKKIVDAPAAAEVNSVSESSTPVHQENVMPTFTHVTEGKSKLVRYTVAGLRGLIRFSPTLFDGPVPETVESFDGLPWANPTAPKQAGEPRPKMTPEEKQAAAVARKNRTPEEIVADAQARAAKTVELAQKRADAQAKKLAATA